MDLTLVFEHAGNKTRGFPQYVVDRVLAPVKERAMDLIQFIQRILGRAAQQDQICVLMLRQALVAFHLDRLKSYSRSFHGP